MSRTEEFGAKSRGQTFMYDPSDLTIVRDKAHPLYDPRVDLPIDEDIVESIIERGVLVPILVRKNGEAKGKPVIEVMDGRQRVKCALAANKKLVAAGKEPVRIPAIMRREDADSAETTMIITNEYRTDDDPMVKAAKLQRYMQHGHTEAEARKAFKLRSGELTELLALIDAAPAVKAAVSEGKVSKALVRDLVKLPEAKQTEVVAAVRDNKEGAKKARDRVQKELVAAGNVPKAPKPKPKTAASASAANPQDIAAAWGIETCPRSKVDVQKARAKLLMLGTRGAKKQWAQGAADALAWVLGDDRGLPGSVRGESRRG